MVLLTTKRRWFTMKAELLSEISRIPDFELVDVFVREGVLEKQPHLRAVVERGRSEAIAVVSDRYNLLQIRELFESAVSCCPGEVDGSAVYYRGKGDLALFPEGSAVGLLIQNSVDRSSAVKVSFCAKVNGEAVPIPAEAAAPFVRVHTAKDLQVEVSRYLSLLGQVREAWEQIALSLVRLELSQEDIEALKRDIGAGKRLSKLIDAYLSGRKPLMFWDFVLAVLMAVRKCRYKTKFHLSRKIRRVGETIIQWAVYEKIRAGGG